MTAFQRNNSDGSHHASSKYRDVEAIELGAFPPPRTPDMAAIYAPTENVPEDSAFSLPDVRAISASQAETSYAAVTVAAEVGNRTVACPLSRRRSSDPTEAAGEGEPRDAEPSKLPFSPAFEHPSKKNVSILTPVKEETSGDSKLIDFEGPNSFERDGRIFFRNGLASQDDDSDSEAVQCIDSASFEKCRMDTPTKVVPTTELSEYTQKKEKRQIRISSSFAICGLIAVGTILVVVVAFIPLFFVNRMANEATTTFLLAETMKGVASIARSRAATLPAFVNVIVFHFLPSQNTTDEDSQLPDTPHELMQSLTNVIARSSPNIKFLNFALDQGDEPTGLYSFTRYVDDFTSLVALWTDERVSPPLYTVTVNASGVVQATPTGTYYDLEERLSNPYGPMMEVVANWRVNGSSVRWLSNSLASSGVYFNYVLPFRVGNRYGYCEAGLPASNIADEAARLIPSLRQHGNLILLDPKSHIVINNSWSQPTSWEDDVNGTSQLVPLSIDNISDTLMAAGMRAVMEQGGFTKVLENDNTALVRFDGGKAFLNLTRITDNYGLDFVVGATVLLEDFEEDFTKATYIVIGVSIGVLVLAIAVAIVIANRVSHQLRKMIPELQKASHLKLTKENATEKSSFWARLCSLQFVDELNALQQSYKKLQDSLREMKSYVPAAMLIPVSDSSNSADDATRDGSASAEANQYQNTQLNPNLLSEKLNVFETVSCMMVYIEMRIGKDMSLFNTVLAATTERIRMYSGILELVGQNFVLISFGAHSNIGDYAKKGMQFVLDAMRSLAPDARDQTVCFVEAGSFKVGTCGTKKRCARVVCGTGHMADVARAMWDINCFVAATSETSSRDDKLTWLPVERLRLPDAAHDITLAELVIAENTKEADSYQEDYEMYKTGLAKMMAGAYSDALSCFSRAQHDYRGHTTRLKSVCELYRKRKVTTGYCRYMQDPFNVLRCDTDVMGQSGSTRSATEAALASATNAANSSSSSNRAALATAAVLSVNDVNGDDAALALDENAELPRSPHGSMDETNEDGTFDMPDFGFTADDPDDDDDCVPSGTDGALLLKLTDHKGKTWHRSNKPIGAGTFSQVYLGLSENGEQVAIKVVPRRSRIYDDRKIVSEILHHAQLKHPNVVKLISYAATSTCIALILEYVPGGSLQQIKEKFGPLPYTVLRRLVADMHSGLRYLHESSIVHGDVKPHNMLLGLHGTCKLSDFGTTEQLGASEDPAPDTEDLDICGTCMYMAPEVARGEKPDMPSDIYSFGISILDLALDRIPYNKQPVKQNQFISALGSGEVFLEIPANELHSELYTVVRDCCKPDPKDRPTIFQLSTYSFFL